MRYNLSEITELIRDRRTIYPEQYSDRKIHREQIELLLNNAVWAPSHGNTQPWKFVVFQDDTLEDLSQTLGNIYIQETPKERQNDVKLTRLIRRPKQSGAVIAVLLSREVDATISEEDDFAAIACAIQNMHLTATAQGLGLFWSTPHVIRSNTFKGYLNLAPHQRCIGLIYLGYPAIEWPKGHRKPIEYKTEWRK